jgi:hypothetical protein
LVVISRECEGIKKLIYENVKDIGVHRWIRQLVSCGVIFGLNLEMLREENSKSTFLSA